MAAEEEEYNFLYHGNDSFNWSYENYHTVCEKEDVRTFAKAFLPVIYILVLVVGLAGNAFVVSIYLHYKKIRTMTDVYILNLALADLLLLLTLPFWAADAVVGWVLGEAMCKITSAMYAMNFCCGMMFLACISVDRYLAVFHSHSVRTFRRHHSFWVCLLVWAVAFTLGLPDMIFSTVQYTSTKKTCIAIYLPSMAQPTKALLEILDVLLSFLLPFLVMFFCYSKVALALLKTSETRQGKKWRAFKVLLAVVGVFITTQLPYNAIKFFRAMDIIYSLVIHCEVSKRLDRAIQITESLALTHSCLNPILYTFVGDSFSQHLLQLVKSLGQKRRSQQRCHQEEPSMQISLNSHSGSQDTSTFTI